LKFPRPHTLKEIAQILDCTYSGPDDFPVLGMNEIHRVKAGDIVFVDHPKYYDKALHSEASIVLINQKVEAPEGKALLFSEDPFRDFNELSKRFAPHQALQQGIHPSASIGANSLIEFGAVIGEDVVIGAECRIGSHVVIHAGTHIGDRVVIQAHSVIGSDAFYYKKRPEGFDRMLSTGKVEIENEVEIGASCTIDRGVSATTRIGSGTKIDNQVHIGHDTEIGRNVLLAAQVGIAGCAVLEDEVTLWGQVGVNSSVCIGEKAVVLGQAGVTKSLEGNKTYFGTPSEDARRKFRELAALRNLPTALEQI
jgi:UDP-3-O-[3-hydroxymyristoyl] glucosamine N-acyltransferase